ncbi:hypothetical protein KTR10_00220 [Candidatus Kaiserbacteria bacterium]|nr:hypothetical protein [Candidatus Kaiserbacteria bacterium]
MTPLLKKLFIVLGVVAVLALAYFVYLNLDTTDEEPLSVTGVEGDAAALEAQELLVRLQRLRSVNVDGAFFSDERFSTLVDIRQQIVDESTGRINPFGSVQ